jgi:hypothetical protein
MALGLVSWLALTGVAAPAASAADAAPATDPLCVDVAQDVGIDFRGAYGTTVIRTPMGAMMQRNMGNGAAVGDYDRDGDLDVYVLGQRGHLDRLYRNELVPEGTALFTDVTEAAGVGEPGLSRVAHFADLDGDGWLDLLLVNDTDPDGRLEPSRLFRNAGDGTFADVTEGSGFAPVGYIVGGASLADPDRDGDLDIFLTYWTQELGGDPARRIVRGIYPAENTFFRNDGGFRFTDLSRDSGLGGVRRDAFGSVFADFDGDDDLDVFVAIDHREDIYYENTGPLSWVDRTWDVGATHLGNDMGVAVTDLGSDGALDLYATNITDPMDEIGTGAGNVLLTVEQLPDGGFRFVDRATDLGVADTAWGWGTAFLDIDLDADLDLYAVQGMDEFVAQTSVPLRDASARLFLGEGATFTTASQTGCEIPGDQRTVIPFDYDRDGDQDLLVTQVAFHTRLLENRTPARGSVTVDLTAAGAVAPGSRVSARVGDRMVTQVVLAGGSYLAGPPLETVFGLDGALAADEIVVDWSDGRSTRLTDVASGSLVHPVP